MANVAKTGIAKQSGFGTANTTFTPVKLTDIGSTELTINKIENDELFGGLDTFAPETGLREAAVGVSGRAYPAVIGHFLQMIAGAPTTDGAADPVFSHVFKPGDTVPPPYTIGFDEPNGIDGYFTDVRASSMTIEQESGDVLKFSLDGIASDRVTAAVTVGAVGLETRAFRYSDFTAEIDTAEFLNFKSLSITIDNPISNIFTLDGEDTAITQEFTGRRSVTLDAQLRFAGDATSFRAEFEDNDSIALVFEWAIDAANSLTIEIPNLKILSHNWSRGFDETTLDISGSAYFDETLTGSIQFTLVNGTAAY
jgi:hypothetical protein